MEESSVGHAKLTVVDKKPSTKRTFSVPCLPLSTLLWALNQTTIDYISLDVEGIEYSILKTFPFSNFDIKTWSIEQLHTNAAGMKDVMDTNGYEYLTHLKKSDPNNALYVDDYIFRKRT